MKSNPITRIVMVFVFAGLLVSLTPAQQTQVLPLQPSPNPQPTPQQPQPTPTPTPAASPVPEPPENIPTIFNSIGCPTKEERDSWQAQWLQHDWEREKYEKKIPTDTVVIHHMADPPGMTWRKLSEIQYKNLYRKVYMGSGLDPYVRGLTPQSGHYRYDENGVLVQVYYAYHAMIRKNGASELLLHLTEVGWHAGSWKENMRALGLSADDDYREGPGPSDVVIQGMARQILEWKKVLPLKYLKSHREVHKQVQKDPTKWTPCPGPWWDTKGPDGKTGAQKLAELTGLQLVPSQP